MRLALLLTILSVQSAFAQKVPIIHVLYEAPNGSIFDRRCPEFAKTSAKPEWIQETVLRRSEFQAAWDKDGPQYLKAALSEIGLPFPYREMQVNLTVCPNVGNMSDPMLINVRNYLSDAANPLRREMFAFGLYHELMHHYVRPVFASSALIKKYSGESLQTQNHLHLMALEKLALVKLKKDSDLMNYVNFNPAYKRAWQIVNDIEGYEAFVKELKAVPKRAVRRE
jgi:hypothetical protein